MNYGQVLTVGFVVYQLIVKCTDCYIIVYGADVKEHVKKYSLAASEHAG